MRDLIKKILKEEVKSVTCECGWSWKLSEGGDDPYVCHKCGVDNTKKYLKESEENDFDWIGDPFGVEYNVIKYLEDNYVIGRWQTDMIEAYDNKVYIVVDDKPYFIDENKKYLVNKLYQELVTVFSEINTPVLRRSIRQYLNDIND